jgi:hypothetical protein
MTGAGSLFSGESKRKSWAGPQMICSACMIRRSGLHRVTAVSAAL